jgi:dephospho-CoA kinase
MRRIALTGGIGSGKTTVAARLALLGAIVIDADALAREVVAVGTPGLAAVIDRFGSEMLDADGALDRRRLGRLVFADRAALDDLNKIVHPLVIARTDELMDAAPPDGVVVYDVPLLVENGAERAAGYDAVLVVEAPLEQRLERLERRGLPRDEARSRITQQADDAERRAVATVVIDNSGSEIDLLRQVDGVWPGLVSNASGR